MRQSKKKPHTHNAMRPLREVYCSDYEEKIALALEVVLDDLKSEFEVKNTTPDCSTFSELDLNPAFRDGENSENSLVGNQFVPFLSDENFEGWYYIGIFSCIFFPRFCTVSPATFSFRKVGHNKLLLLHIKMYFYTLCNFFVCFFLIICNISIVIFVDLFL